MIIGEQIPIHGVGRIVTVVPYTPVQGRGRELPMGLSYSSVGFDINPFDIAYRADTKEEAAADLGYLLFRVGQTVTNPTFSVGRTTLSIVLDLFS